MIALRDFIIADAVGVATLFVWLLVQVVRGGKRHRQGMIYDWKEQGFGE